MMDAKKIALFWHRRDLRIDDNTALFHALKSDHQLIPFFIFDQNILNKLQKDDKRIFFILNELQRLKKEYQKHHSDLLVFYGNPSEIITHLIVEHQAKALYFNKDYEPYAVQRDIQICKTLSSLQTQLFSYKDHVIFEENEILKNDGTPYLVFTYYAKKWREKLQLNPIQLLNINPFLKNLKKTKQKQILISERELGFNFSEKIEIPSRQINDCIIHDYQNNRDFPALNGTSKLGIHFRFGTISIREGVMHASCSYTFLNELIWREFYQMLIFHFPHSAYSCFKKMYDQIEWNVDEQKLEKWMKGQTGFPIIDAGMRELNETGFMHNRVRMLVASFFCKNLGFDWRIGESYFAEKLLDYECASNVGSWQWVAGTGCDAAPYYRVFNPILQQEKFDPECKYIKKWVKEWNTPQYPSKIVDFQKSKLEILQKYKKVMIQY